MFFALNALWEAAQLPLYTLWQRGSWYDITFALVHCTIGDLLIGVTVTAVSAAVLFLLTKSPPKLASGTFLGLFLVLGIAYSVFSEWLNVEVRETWAYTEQMPVLPPLGTGLTPIFQWLIVPTLTWALMVRQRNT